MASTRIRNSTRNGSDGRRSFASSLDELTLNQLWRMSGSARSATPSPMPAKNVTGMLVSRPHAAAAIVMTSSSVKMSAFSVWASVVRMTPAMPAITLESIHATALTRSEFTPASSTMRGLSTTARICSPIAVYRKMKPRISTASTVTIAAIAKSHDTKCVPMLNPGALMPNIGGMLDLVVTGTGCCPLMKSRTIWGNAMNMPSTVTSFTCHPALRIARNKNRSKARPSSGDTMRIATTRPSQRGLLFTSTSSTYTAAATKAWAANAKLKTPVVL